MINFKAVIQEPKEKSGEIVLGLNFKGSEIF